MTFKLKFRGLMLFRWILIVWERKVEGFSKITSFHWNYQSGSIPWHTFSVKLVFLLWKWYSQWFEKTWIQCNCAKYQGILNSHCIDGWMTCDFTSCLTVFQSYQDDVWMIMKGCVQWNSVYGWEDFTSNGDRTRSARSVSQRLTNWATGAPTVFIRLQDGAFPL